MNIFDVIKRSNAGQALTPMERAVLKAMLGALITSLSLLLPYGNDILAGRIDFSKIDWLHLVEMIAVSMVLAGAAKILGTLSPSDQATSAALQQAEQNAQRSEVGAITNLPNIVPPIPPLAGGVFSPPAGPGGDMAKIASDIKATLSVPLVLPGAPITSKDVIETLTTQEMPVVEPEK